MSNWTLTDQVAIILKSYGVDDPEAARAVVALVLGDALRKITDHSCAARKKMSVCYDECQREDVDVWSAIIAHLDIAQDEVRALISEAKP